MATDDDSGAGSGPTPPPDDGADHSPVVQTPEEVARAFIESGARMVPVKAQTDPTLPGRRRRMVAGIAAAVIILAVLAAVTLLHTNQPAPATSTHTTQASVVTPVKRTVPPTTSSTTTTTAPAALPPASSITVTVLNASTVDGLATQTSLALGQAGFTMAPPGTAPTKLPAGSPSQILYGPGGFAAAHVLAASLGGPVTLVLSPLAQGTNLTLQVASAQLTVIPPGASTTTTSTAPAANP